ncbi:polyketide synthase [Aspergillus ellipticus CBS 707.79]|uniref:Polyketide synthase n=1 Tax=Aspergillus ellipticus CBS 707.79 TaxID=1448320 RepID=A0A319DXI1_9EURO|nr:polyketide synthase [Aspergillus ellipticus CBS 707.79]
MSADMPSVAIFSAQSSPPTKKYLAHIRSRLCGTDETLWPIRDAILSLKDTWRILAARQDTLAALEHGNTAVECFSTWLTTGESSILETSMAGMVTLPLLTVILVVQYVEYLRYNGISHRDFLDSIAEGGAQGCCIGLLVAVAVAAARNESELAKNAAAAIRIALGIGACGDVGEDLSTGGATTMTIRVREGDMEKLLARFPGSYISLIRDQNTISISCNASQMASLKSYANAEGLNPKMIHIQSRLHTPANSALAQQLMDCCNEYDDMRLPNSGNVQVPVRSNRTGEPLANNTVSSTSEVIHAILTSRCDWSTVMSRMSLDLRNTGRDSHALVLFGIRASVPMSSFHQHGLDIAKVDALSLTTNSGLKASNSPHRITDGRCDSASPYPADAIAIVGASCRLPGANSLEELWDLVSRGESRLQVVDESRFHINQSFRGSHDPAWASHRFYGNFIADVDGFDHAFFGIIPREATFMDPQQRLLLSTAYEALDESGYLRDHCRDNGDSVGCFIGASYTEYLENTSGHNPSAFTATGTIRAFLSGKISHHFGWTGPSEVIDTACSASMVALHRACQAIQVGDCSLALAGGVNIITGVNNYFDLAKAGFLSPSGQCKPFDNSADGYCRADGVGLVVLKSLRQAISDGNRVLGVIASSATNQGGLHSPSITVPDCVAQQALYSDLLSKAGLSPHQVSYVEAHGTGTQVGDPIEIRSIREVFGRAAQRMTPVHIGSLKANIGHSETAAGIASVLKVLAMLSHRSIPPLAGFRSDNMRIPSLAIPWNPTDGGRIACVNSYGASGSNAAEQPSMVCPVLLSAASLASFLAHSGHIPLGNVAFTLGERRKHHRVRWTTTARDMPTLLHQLQQVPKDVGIIAKDRKPVVLAFSGQSKTTIGLGPALLRAQPRFHHHLRTCADILQSLGHPDIMPALTQSDPVSDVLALQCGTFAMQYACARCWIEAGVQVDAIVGHSLGELTALAVSGVLSLTEILKLIAYRATLMQTKWGPERGTMMAIHANLETVRGIVCSVESVGEALEIACHNSRTSHIVVGRESSITLAETMLRNGGIRHKRLDVSHGFHSKFTEPLLPYLVQFAENLKFKSPAIPLETCTESPVDWCAVGASYVASHSRDPVYFVNAIERIEQRLGPCIWLEAGCGTPVVAMAKKAVSQPELHVFQTSTCPAKATTALWREGIPASFWAFLTPAELGVEEVWLPPYQFETSRHWLAHVDHATEQKEPVSNGSKSKPKLVSYLYSSRPGEEYHAFRIHTETERYTRIVKGHAVRQLPLCPASVYMECAAMAATLLNHELRDRVISFENISFHRGLGCDENMAVDLRIGRDGYRAHDESLPYNFEVHSPKGTHVEGQLCTLQPTQTDVDLYSMLVSEHINTLKLDPHAERLTTRIAYLLFSRVVEYADLLQGISCITLKSNQALAEVMVPRVTWTREESSMVEMVDAVTLDTFVQVLGLLVNSSCAVNSDIYVATAIDKMLILPCDFRREQTWTVYATFKVVSSSQTTGSIFAFSESGELIVMGTGIQFSRVQASKFERLLQATTTSAREVSDKDKTVAALQPVQQVQSAQASDNLGELKLLVSLYTGIKVSDIQDQESLGSMGLDSLAVIELADELRVKLGIVIPTDELLSSSISTLRGFSPVGHDLSPALSSQGTVVDIVNSSTSFSPPTPAGVHSSWTRHCDLNSRHKVKTVVYKEADGVSIHADLMIPINPPSHGMPIALMIHGGGHMTLSRKAIRPAQTAHLLSRGIFPLSIDYRLCPQVSLLEGPMSDVRDAYAWAQTELPRLLLNSEDIVLDPTKIIVIGWSTGGHLAMTSAWTTPALGLSPPVAILAFYCPTDYDPAVLRGKLVTTHAISTTDTSNLGWLKSDDPRSELVLALIKEKNGTSLLFHGIPTEEYNLRPPSTAQVAAVSPVAQLRAGNYRTPTFLVIGEEDEIVPLTTAVKFSDARNKYGVAGGLLVVPGARHVHDLTVLPGTQEWEVGVGPGYEFLLRQLETAFDSGE